jgi:hypothetical protein
MPPSSVIDRRTGAVHVAIGWLAPDLTCSELVATGQDVIAARRRCKSARYRESPHPERASDAAQKSGLASAGR